MNKNDYDFLFKFILIGDSSVGKSCLLMRLLQGRFKSQHEPTLGVEFGSKLITLNNKAIKLQIWDTAGQESFKSITRAYYKSSIAAILTFDITNQQSFDNIAHWLYQLRNHSHQKIHIVLIGNKKDLSKDREVSEETASDFARRNNFVRYYETSALNGQNVERVFIDLGAEILKNIESKKIDLQIDTAYGVRVGPKNKSKYMNSNIQLLKQPLKKPINGEKKSCIC